MSLIQHQVLSSAQSSITLSNIPQNYTDLIIKMSVRNDAGDPFVQHYISVNSGTGSVTSLRLRVTYNSVTNSQQTVGYFGFTPGDTATASTFSNNEIYIFNYSSSGAKTWSNESTSENNSTANAMGLHCQTWSLTDPITSVTLSPQFGNFMQHSSVTLYGVLKGSDGTTTVS